MLSGTQRLGTDPCIVPHGFWHHGMSLPDTRASPVSNLGPKVGVLSGLSIVNPSYKGLRVCGIIKCIYSISVPSSWHQAPKTLGIYVNEVTSEKTLGSLRMGAGCQGKLRRLELSASPPNLGLEEELVIEVYHQWPMT